MPLSLARKDNGREKRSIIEVKIFWGMGASKEAACTGYPQPQRTRLGRRPGGFHPHCTPFILWMHFAPSHLRTPPLSIPALYPWNALSSNIPPILAHPSDLCLLREVFLNFLDSIGFCPFPSVWSYIAITCNCVFVCLTTSSMGSGTRPGIRHQCIPRVWHST